MSSDCFFWSEAFWSEALALIAALVT